MKRSSIVLIAVVVLAILVGGYFVLRGRTADNSTAMGSMNMSSSKSTDGSTTATPEATNAVTIQNFAFTPASITVKAGTKVTWTNSDSTAHTVTEADGQTGPDSSAVNPGSSYSFTFTTAGTYHYHCTFHPDMLGTVTVTD